MRYEREFHTKEWDDPNREHNTSPAFCLHPHNTQLVTCWHASYRDRFTSSRHVHVADGRAAPGFGDVVLHVILSVLKDFSHFYVREIRKGLSRTETINSTRQTQTHSQTAQEIRPSERTYFKEGVFRKVDGFKLAQIYTRSRTGTFDG